ncbi:MAG: hypothetical protein ACI81T_003814, partial [Bacteroidia bacterium]
LERFGAEITVILTDLDDDACITKTKERIHPNELTEEEVGSIVNLVKRYDKTKI